MCRASSAWVRLKCLSRNRTRSRSTVSESIPVTSPHMVVNPLLISDLGKSDIELGFSVDSELGNP